MTQNSSETVVLKRRLKITRYSTDKKVAWADLYIRYSTDKKFVNGLDPIDTEKVSIQYGQTKENVSYRIKIVNSFKSQNKQIVTLVITPNINLNIS